MLYGMALAFGYSVMLFAFVLICKWLYDYTCKLDFGQELIVKNNQALGIHIAGYIGGVGIAISGLTYGLSGEFKQDIVYIWPFLILIAVLFRISIIIMDYILLPKISVNERLATNDTILATRTAAISLATGLVLRNSLIGLSDNILTALLDTLILFLIGQFFIIVTSLIFKLFGLDNQSDASSIVSAGYLLATGLIVSQCVLGMSQYLLTCTKCIAYITVFTALLPLVAAFSWYNVTGSKFSVVGFIRSWYSEIVEQNNTGVAWLSAALLIILGLSVASVI